MGNGFKKEKKKNFKCSCALTQKFHSGQLNLEIMWAKIYV